MSNALLILFLLSVGVLTFGWIISRVQREEAGRTRTALRWLLSAALLTGLILLLVKLAGLDSSGSLFADFGVVLFLVGAIAICAIFLGLLFAPQLGSWMARPIISLFDGGSQELERQPMYAIALAHRKRGRYPRAIAEIQKQLAAFPGDYPGTLMLAEIQIESQRDVSSAIQILEDWIVQFGQQSDRVPSALHQIADWHLGGRSDPGSARHALERIQQLHPDSEAAHIARRRLAHLASTETLSDRADPHRIRIEQYPERVGLMTEPLRPPPPQDPAALAAAYLSQLEQFPDDNETRENLARLYAEQFKNLALARVEFEWLLAQSRAPERQIVRWLNLLAHVELQTSGDLDAARATLERIVDRFPKSAAAQQARQRIALLALELRGKQKSQTFRLGSAENPTPDSRTETSA
jgi:tetratricopeptide (TPR) repeat protein